jgi:hypothetical protein
MADQAKPTCNGPECSRPAKLKGLCASHYMQARRGDDLKPLRSGEDSAQVGFRCSPALKKAAEKAAKKERIDSAEWWRRAGKNRLGEK